jgi:polyisoprenyl-teichoic acid--peptidoglycan teichoic acid transferase
MTARPRTVLLTLIGPPLCGVLVACLVMAAWVATGLPIAKGETWLTVQKVPPLAGASFTSGQPDHVQFFLVVGNDSYGEQDRGGVGLGDAIHVIGVNPEQHAATILDIPRDTSISGGAKINATLATSGLAAFTQTISQFVGVPITFSMTTNFDDFIKLVNDMGGLDINIPQTMVDLQNSGANFQAGPIHLAGEDALAFTRDRHSFSEGDIKRTQNQGYLIITALQNLQQRNTGPGGALSLLGSVGRHVKMENASLRDLYRLGRLVLTIDPANIKNVVIPTGGGAGSNLSPGAGIDSLFADFRDDGVLQSH